MRAITYDHLTENPLFVKVLKLEQYKTFARTFHRRIAIFPPSSFFILAERFSFSRTRGGIVEGKEEARMVKDWHRHNTIGRWVKRRHNF